MICFSIFQIILCNFIRVAGDLLPASLFVPYLEMLTGLASSKHSAHHCFNLLKTNAMNAAGSVHAVSWDHFFDSLKRYYVDLRHENVGECETMSSMYVFAARMY